MIPGSTIYKTMLKLIIFQRLTSDEVESKLKDVLLVLKYVQNKDVFMRYHKVGPRVGPDIRMFY